LALIPIEEKDLPSLKIHKDGPRLGEVLYDVSSREQSIVHQKCEVQESGPADRATHQTNSGGSNGFSSTAYVDRKGASLRFTAAKDFPEP
jgi:hypothetical protein